MLNDSVFNIGKKYYSLEFLEECKCILKEKKINSNRLIPPAKKWKNGKEYSWFLSNMFLKT